MGRVGLLLLWIQLFGGSAVAQEIRKERVTPAEDSAAVTIEGAIEGYEIVDYLFDVRAGATLCARLETSSTANYFNVLPSGSDTALFVGSVAGGEWTGELTVAGEYAVRVYLMRSAARRGEAAAYTLVLGLAADTDGSAGCPLRQKSSPEE
jgi:hypothetical protein